MYPVNDYCPTPEPAKPARPTYALTDTVYAWLSFAFGFFLCQALPVTKYPLGGFLLIAAIYLSGFVVLRLKKQKLPLASILCALSAMVINAALLLTDTKFLLQLSLGYSLASYCYFLYAAFGNRIEEGFSDYIYMDFIKILFILPFRSLTAIYHALSNRSAQKGFRFLLKCLIGIGIALIPTALIFAFLSYDAGFLKLVDDIFSFDMRSIRRAIVSLLFTPPLAMYGFGLYESSKNKLLKNQIVAQDCKDGLRKVRILPQVTAIVAIVPILFLYVVFFISQREYYISGFTGVLPEHFSYAEYARQGFFELCSVSVINLILIISIVFFIKRNKNDTSVILKLVTTIFCLCTLILISTAVAKLIMYIHSYGLTQKRIYAMWLMALIGIIFLVIALGQFLPKIKVVAVSLSIAVVMFAGLAVCNVNALCAQYNVDEYLSGELETIDVSAMRELGDSAIPALVQAVKSDAVQNDPQLKRSIDKILQNKLHELEDEDYSIFSFSIPSALASDALEDYTSN